MLLRRAEVYECNCTDRRLGDLIAFRTAAVSEYEHFNLARWRCNEYIERVLKETQADFYEVFISGNSNFRKEVDPEYKANRKDKAKPIYLEDLKEYLIVSWDATVTDGCEADDALGFNQTGETIICSIDKDMLQIPGKHYNFVKQEFITVTELQGLQHFYKQLLIGDAVDNIFGVRGIGPKKAAKLIEPLTDELEMFHCVRRLYDYDDTRLFKNSKLLWILREEGKIWEPNQDLLAYSDQLRQEEAAMSATSEKQKTDTSENTGQETSG